jgi:hypothetical protein
MLYYMSMPDTALLAVWIVETAIKNKIVEGHDDSQVPVPDVHELVK